MKNFAINIEGKEYWVARNIAVACFVFAPRNGEWCVLANKRGKGTPDFQGYWNCPCGYLDFDETIEEAARREVYEETGINLNYAKFFDFSDDIDANHQNVTFKYYSILSNAEEIPEIKNRGGENDEVDEVRWIPVSNIHLYNWAFDHDFIIEDLMMKYYAEH